MRCRMMIVAVLLTATCVLFAGGAKKPIPLQQAVLDAKTAYIDNQSSDARLTARAISDLKEWGRLTVVDDRSKADLVLVMITEIQGKNESGDQYGSFTMQVFIPHDDIPQFSSTFPDGVRFMERDVTKSLKLLRKRIEEQSGASASSGTTQSK